MGFIKQLIKTIKDVNKEYRNAADEQYIPLISEIIEKGELKENRTGVNAFSLPHKMLQFDLEDEFPLLTTKFVGLKTAIKEMLWIWQDQSNSVELLRNKYNVTIWDEWERKDGTIGLAYGYQLGKEYKYFDVLVENVAKLKKEGKIKNYRLGKNGEIYMSQVDKLIYDLHFNKDSRRMVVSLWNVEDLNNMALQPCAFLTEWNVTNGKLNLLLNIRSSDTLVGLPYNMAQYAFLLLLMAQTCGLKPGLFTIMINDAHVYENHLRGAFIQVGNRSHYAPKVEIKSRVKSFYDFRIDDLILEDYEHSGKIPFEVAV